VASHQIYRYNVNFAKSRHSFSFITPKNDKGRQNSSSKFILFSSSRLIQKQLNLAHHISHKELCITEYKKLKTKKTNHNKNIRLSKKPKPKAMSRRLCYRVITMKKFLSLTAIALASSLLVAAPSAQAGYTKAQEVLISFVKLHLLAR